EFSLRNRWAVIVIFLCAAGVGVYSLGQLDVDAFPDTTPVQIQINTTAPSLLAEEVERQITFPIEQVLSGLPGLEQVRSTAEFGCAPVTVVGGDGIGIYFARQLVHERLSNVELPAGIERPQVGPVATGLGEVLRYIVRYKDLDLTALSPEERIAKLTE